MSKEGRATKTKKKHSSAHADGKFSPHVYDVSDPFGVIDMLGYDHNHRFISVGLNDPKLNDQLDAVQETNHSDYRLATQFLHDGVVRSVRFCNLRPPLASDILVPLMFVFACCFFC